MVAVARPTADGSFSKANKTDTVYAQDGETEITFWRFWGSPVRHTAIRRVIAICEQQMDGIK